MANTGLTRRYASNVPAQGTAATGQSQIVAEIKQPGTVSEVAIQSAAAVTLHAANYRIFTMYNRGPAGAGTTVIATMDTSTIGLADNDERLMTLSATAANLVVAADDILEIVETVAASGVAHGGYRVEVAVAGSTA